MWDNLTDFMADSEENILPMIDVSGSMFGTPLAVAIGLGMYLGTIMFLNLIGFRLIKYINIPEIALKDRYGIEIIAKL